MVELKSEVVDRVGVVDPWDIAGAVLEKRRRIEQDKILFYKPCCRPHKNNCPSIPCPDSLHTKFHLSDKRIRIIFGGNRSSKTTTCLMEMIMSSCFKYHPYRKTKNASPGYFRIYETDYGVLEKLIIPKLMEWIPMGALDGKGQTKGAVWDDAYDPKYHILRLKGGSMIDFLSYDQDSSKSESVELDGVFADEQMPERIYSATMARLITKNGFFMMGVTPLYDISWALKFLDNIDPQVDVYHFNIWDNPYNSDRSIQEFQDSIPEHEKEARLYGRFLELQGLVYKELNKDVHLLGDSPPKPGYPVIFALDPHPRKASVMTWSYITPKGDVVFFDELELKANAKVLTAAIRQKESSHPAKTVLRLIDPAARAQGSDIAFETDTLREFEREGMGFTIADNSEAGYNIVHEYLYFDSSKPIDSFNRPKLFFTKGALQTWYGMTHLMWDEWAFKKTLRDEKERIRDYKKDFPDCVRYTMAVRPSYYSLMSPRAVPIGNWQNAYDWEKRKRDSDHLEMRRLILNR